jgi:hypothetical protein
VEFALNNAPSASTGVTPFYANYGFHPRTPSSTDFAPHSQSAADLHQSLLALHEYIHTQLQKATTCQAKYANEDRKEVEFEEGDFVLLSTENLAIRRPSAKLNYRYVGPFRVVMKNSPVSYRLDLPDSMARLHPVFHVSLLELYRNPSSGVPVPRGSAPPAPVLLEDEEEWEVEMILDMRGGGRSVEYLVRWVGYPLSASTWEPLANLAHCKEALKEFHNRRTRVNAPKVAKPHHKLRPYKLRAAGTSA